METTLAGFARAVRAAGIPVTPDRTHSFLQAVAAVGVGDPRGVYWAGRSTLCAEPDHFATYDRVFESWFAGQVPRLVRGHRPPQQRPTPGLLDSPAGGRRGEQEQPPQTEILRARASDLDVLRHRDVAELSPQERRLLAQLFATIRPAPPRRRASRRRPHHRGELDARRTLREELRRGGEPGPIRYRRHSTRPRRVVLLLDVSGSMSPYADALLRLAHVCGAQRPAQHRGVHHGHPAHPDDPGDAAPRSGRRPARRRRAGAGLVGRHPAGRGAARPSSTAGASAGRPGARSWCCSPTAGSAAARWCWRRRWPGCAGSRTASCGSTRTGARPATRPLQGGIAAALPSVDYFVAGHRWPLRGAGGRDPRAWTTCSARA